MGEVVSRRPKRWIDAHIVELVESGEALLVRSPGDADAADQFRGDFLDWDRRASEVLEASFEARGMFTSAPVDDFRSLGAALLDLQIGTTTLPLERVPEVPRVIREKCRVLRAIRARLDIYEPDRDEAHKSGSNASAAGSIFLVHGHDHALREKVRRYLEHATERSIVVLDEQPNKGRDVLSKLLDHALEAAFAVVLMTGDDEGRVAGGGSWSPRARQNVILELGLFLGLLGRNRVVALYETSVEMPSDYSGVLWVPIEGDGWAMRLASELKAAGIEVNLNKVI